MRDKLIHDYTGVNLSYVWQVANEHVPILYTYIKMIIAELEQESENGL